MSEELTAQNKIKILSVGFPFGNPDDAGMSVFYGPHGCTALFVSGITSSIGKKECEAMQKAIASVLDGDMEPRPTSRAPHIIPNDVDCKGCPERQNQGLVWTKEPPTVPGWSHPHAGGTHVMTCTPTYPNPGVQHTRCVLALTATQACLEVFRPAADCGTALKRQLDKISRWVAACAQQTRKKPLSAGAKRDLDKRFRALEEYMITEDMDDETRFRRWAALIWAALTFVEDACNTCPVYARAPQWRYLRQTVNTLAEKLRELEPGMDEEGTAIYEEAA